MGAATTSGVILDSTDSVKVVLNKIKECAEANPEKKSVFGASNNGFIFDERGP
jgi:hypothetical protein